MDVLFDKAISETATRYRSLALSLASRPLKSFKFGVLPSLSLCGRGELKGLSSQVEPLS